MEDGHENRFEDGWQARDVTSGVAKVYQEAKRRSTLGIRVAGLWAFGLLFYAALDFTELAYVAPPAWDVIVGVGSILLAALAMSRTSAPLLTVAALIIVDLGFVAFRIPRLFEQGAVTDYTMSGLRVALAPVALYFVLNGYLGSLSIETFKKGFSPGGDWRTRINPLMLQFVIVASCLMAMAVGMMVWMGTTMEGFRQTDVIWETKALFLDPIELQVARPEGVQEAEKEGEAPGVLAEIEVLENKNGVGFDVAAVLPENAIPIVSLDGLDDFARAAVEEAFEFAAETDEAGCLLEAQGRQDRCRDDRCRYWSRVFARACFAKSKSSVTFCDVVPSATLVAAGENWARRMCAGRDFETCRELLYSIQGHCHPPEPVATRPAAARGKSKSAKPGPGG